MIEEFEKVMSSVCKAFNKEWYEVYDSNLFYIVDCLIKDTIFNEDYLAMTHNNDYINWCNEMRSKL